MQSGIIVRIYIYLGNLVLAAARFVVLLVYFILINTGLLLVFILRPMHKNNVYLGGQVYSTMAKIMGISLEVRATDKLDFKKSYLYIANHQNSYDLMTVAAAARPGVVTIGKKSLKWIPVFGLIYWLSGNIMIDRKNTSRAKDTLDITAEKVKRSGLSIFMFPEGTRSRGRGILPFKTGAFRLAQQTKQPIVPVICSDLSQIKMNKWDNGVVLVSILDPIEMEGQQNPRQMANYFEELMKIKYKELNDEISQMTSEV
ncbi:1-acylglycerol-3-phosphate O-acyltransferase [Glaciecola sp. 1036]|uniref:1-acylglycerol-3-phosphate O-acyltransferase n=1 Tax=Alteromonadaceae TaxID=72275 RepID=UPI003CFD4671